MPEELQSLLDRIQKEGVDKAEAEAQRILAEAKKKAASMTAEAEQAAKALKENGQKEADAFMERARKTLEQAARDVVLSVKESVDATFRALVKEGVDTALTPEVLKDMLVCMVRSYCDDKTGGGIQVLLPSKQQEAVVALFMAEFKAKAEQGIEITSDSRLLSGFRVTLVDDGVEHDFSGEAIADALCSLIRPHLAEIVKKALKE